MPSGASLNSSMALICRGLQGLHNTSQALGVFRVSGTGVMQEAVAVGNNGNWHNEEQWFSNDLVTIMAFADEILKASAVVTANRPDVFLCRMTRRNSNKILRSMVQHTTIQGVLITL